jgi:hypothetical protein
LRSCFNNTPAPAVVPTVAGGVQLEWHIGCVDIEIRIQRPDPIRVYASDTDSGDVIETAWPPGQPVEFGWLKRISG